MPNIIIVCIILIGVYLLIGYMLFKVRNTSKPFDQKNGKKQICPGQNQVNSSIYDADYYLHAYSGDLRGYLSNLENLPIPLQRCFQYAQPRPGEKVLDLGCGRGHLAYFCATKQCQITAIDYSSDAIALAVKAKEALPRHLTDNMVVKQMDFKDLDTKEEYDVIFMADLLEHLHDWELKILFEKVKKMLKPQAGRLVIHTAPNKTWINVIFPLKRILDWPSTLRKDKDFCYTRDKYSYDAGMHVNEQTLGGVKRLLKGFQAKVWCDDGSANIISILTKRFAGADIWAIARV
ncbi:MAG: class I SAM-dependent methyltransferase [Candidatus Omnitrophica bacterium]|nr:class I SAM-dependent methyltransferase [Candidatus Omnitrophota bacterium]